MLALVHVRLQACFVDVVQVECLVGLDVRVELFEETAQDDALDPFVVQRRAVRRLSPGRERDQLRHHLAVRNRRAAELDVRVFLLEHLGQLLEPLSPQDAGEEVLEVQGDLLATLRRRLGGRGRTFGRLGGGRGRRSGALWARLGRLLSRGGGRRGRGRGRLFGWLFGRLLGRLGRRRCRGRRRGRRAGRQ